MVERDSFASVWEVFAAVPDHRRAAGRRYPLAGLLLIALAAVGIGRGRVPAPSVWGELFRDLDVVSLERLPGVWVMGEAAAATIFSRSSPTSRR